MPNGKVYGFKNYPQFIEDFLVVRIDGNTTDIVEPVLTLTNHYKALLDDRRRILRSEGKDVS